MKSRFMPSAFSERAKRARAGISASHGAHHEAKKVITTGVPIELPSFGSTTGAPPSSAGSVAGSLMLGVDLPPKPNRPSARRPARTHPTARYVSRRRTPESGVTDHHVGSHRGEEQRQVRDRVPEHRHRGALAR